MAELPKTADFVILGAGVMGTSIAFHLAKRKAGKIVVLDKDHVGHGGSGRSSALIRMHYTFLPEVKLALVSLKIFQEWQQYVGAPGDFRTTGFVRLVHPEETEKLKRNVERQRAAGVEVNLLGPQELKELEPDWQVDDVVLAAYEPKSGHSDGAGVANDFLNAARELGIHYVPRTKATEFDIQDNVVRGVKTDQGQVAAPVVVAAMGPWSGPLFHNTGYEVSIESEYHQVAVLRNPSDMKSAGCSCIDSATATYFRSDGSDKSLVGDFYGHRPVDPDNFPQRPSDTDLEDLIERASHRLPKLAKAEVMRGVTGIYDMTPDSRPLLGAVPGIGGLHICAGFSGMGFKLSPAIGLVMSELLLDGQSSTVDIMPFRPSRFAESQAIAPPDEYKDEISGVEHEKEKHS